MPAIGTPSLIPMCQAVTALNDTEQGRGMLLALLLLARTGSLSRGWGYNNLIHPHQKAAFREILLAMGPTRQALALVCSEIEDHLNASANKGGLKP